MTAAAAGFDDVGTGYELAMSFLKKIALFSIGRRLWRTFRSRNGGGSRRARY